MQAAAATGGQGATRQEGLTPQQAAAVGSANNYNAKKPVGMSFGNQSSNGSAKKPVLSSTTPAKKAPMSHLDAGYVGGVYVMACMGTPMPHLDPTQRQLAQPKPSI